MPVCCTRWVAVLPRLPAGVAVVTRPSAVHVGWLFSPRLPAGVAVVTRPSVCSVSSHCWRISTYLRSTVTTSSPTTRRTLAGRWLSAPLASSRSRWSYSSSTSCSSCRYVLITGIIVCIVSRCFDVNTDFSFLRTKLLYVE